MLWNMKNDLPLAFDFQISLTINCESTWPGIMIKYSQMLVTCSNADFALLPKLSNDTDTRTHTHNVLISVFPWVITNYWCFWWETMPYSFTSWWQMHNEYLITNFTIRVPKSLTSTRVFAVFVLALINGASTILCGSHVMQWWGEECFEQETV